MSLRRKTLLITGLTLATLLAALGFGVRTILLNSFRDLEDRQARKTLERAHGALSRELANLSATAGDWALWDDTYLFVEDLNQEYVEANLAGATFANLRVNLMAFVRPSGEIAYYKNYDLETGEERRLPDELRPYLGATSSLLRLQGPDSSASGIVLLPEGPMLVASRPIMTSERQGPSRGALILGRYLGEGELQRLAEAAGAPLEVLPRNDPLVPRQIGEPPLDAADTVIIRPRDLRTLSAYALLTDPEAQPAAVLHLDIPREIYAHGRKACYFLVTSLFLVGVTLGAVMLGVVTEKLFLSRLTRLKAAASAIASSKDFSARLPVSGHDELASLAASMNDTLGALEQARLDEQKAQQELREASELLQGVVESMPLGICVIDREGRVKLWNAPLESVSGVPRAEILGRNVFERFPGLVDAGLKERFAQVLADGQPQAVADLPFSDQTLPQRQYQLSIRAHPLSDASGRVTGAVVTVRDISERKRIARVQEVTYRIADAAVRATSVEGLARFVREALGSIIDTKNFYIAIYDAEQDAVLFPYYVDETLPEPGYDTTFSRKASRGLTEYVMRTGEGLLLERDSITDLASRGEIEIIGELPAVWLGAPLELGGTIIGIVAVQNYTDASAYSTDDLWLLKFVSGQIAGAIERKRAEEAVARSRDFYLTLFDEFPALIWRCNAEGKCDYCNRSWQRFTGRPMEQELGDGWLDAVYPEDRDAFTTQVQQALPARQPFELECRLRRHDGQHRWFLVVARPYRDLNDQFAGYLASCYDITERKRLEDQFRQAQKMEAIGRLAGGIAHDFNNLLTAITGYATFVRDALAADSPVREDINQVLKSADRATSLVRQLLVFSRRQPGAPSITNLNEVVINLGKMLRRLISEDIELVTLPGPDLGAVHVDAGQIEQVLINLVVNAGDAMPTGGKLTIETSNVTLDADYARQHVDVTPGEYVMLAVSDTGCGMTDEVKARVFEPFFTTKEPGKGTGLGLATSYGIVKQNGGHIWFYSEPGKGTTFKIYFPRTLDRSSEPHDPGDALRLPGVQTVLLVEDDAAVRSFAARGLREAGYRVLEAASGPEALGVAAQQSRVPIHLLVTDLVMPQMGGDELARRLRVSHPELKALFVSGYAPGAVNHRGAIGEETAFVEKPFSLATLIAKVREVLAG
ncbi:MAG: CHASE4 domain-containing protein [Anaerolineae bacterium]|nr:CHASE4 domain-containing protein [Anaerolineae bacterium]